MTAVDYCVLLAYLVAVAVIGFSAAHARSTFDYFLGSRKVPWWAAGFSVIATETSALTLIGAPVQSLRGDWTYLQLAFGSVLGRLIVSRLLLTAYYRAGVYTVYGYLEERFGPWSRNAGSGLFFIGRVLGSGVRLYSAAIALVLVFDFAFPGSVVTIAGREIDLIFPAAIFILAAISVAYTVNGGIRAVIWTEVLQAILFIGGGLLALGYLVHEGGGVSSVYGALASGETAAQTPKLKLLDFSVDPGHAYTLLAGLIGSAFLTMSTHGTDQDMIQRCFTVTDERGAQRSMLMSAAINIPMAALFLAVGSALWVVFGGDAGAADIAARIAAEKHLSTPDKGFDFIFPYYVVQSFPMGVRGLVLAGILAASMSSLDSAITALSSTGVKCVWETYVRPRASEAHYVLVSRWMSVGFALVIAVVAIWVYLAEDTGSAQLGFGVLMLGLKVLSWVFPPLLGIFLVGVLTARGRDGGNLIALAAGIGVLLFVEFWPVLLPLAADGKPRSPPFAWTWNALIGCAITFCIAALFPPRARAAAELARAA